VEATEVLTCLADGARQIVQADAVMVRLLDERGTHLTVAAGSGLPAALLHREPIPVEQCPLDEEVLSGQPVVVVDARADSRAVGVPQAYRSVLCMPLLHAGDAIGTLHVYATAPGRFCGEVTHLLTPLVELGVMALAATRALGELEVLETSKAHFIHVATHELRSPVAVSQSLVRGVLKGYAGELTDKQRDLFGRISRRLDFLESLINDLLDLAAGKVPALAEGETAVLLNTSVGRAVLLLQPRAEEKGVALTYHACCEELVVRGTEEGLDRIFVNLVDNGIKYTPPGGSVTVALRRVGKEVEVLVADTGIGIPDDAMPHLFEEFYRAPNAKAVDEVGTGLGLAIVRDLVRRYGGHIEVESSVGQGTTFTVTFPLLPVEGR